MWSVFLSKTTEIILGTKNPGKYSELHKLLAVDAGLVYIPIPKHVPEVDETGITFRDNAILKAKEICAVTGFPTVADDSGIEVRSLGWYPGVFSARWAPTGEKAQCLLEYMDGIKDRYARMISVVALVIPEHPEDAVFFSGLVSGTIAETCGLASPEGLEYDSVFIPREHTKVFSELGPAVKNQISHRAAACSAMKSYMKAVFCGPRRK